MRWTSKALNLSEQTLATLTAEAAQCQALIDTGLPIPPDVRQEMDDIIATASWYVTWHAGKVEAFVAEQEAEMDRIKEGAR